MVGGQSRTRRASPPALTIENTQHKMPKKNCSTIPLKINAHAKLTFEPRSSEWEHGWPPMRHFAIFGVSALQHLFEHPFNPTAKE